jgi:hypothetical protein
MDPHLVFGWCQDDRENKLDETWLDKYKIESFVLDVVRLHAGEFFYGLPCDLDEDTGAASVTEENRKLVEEAHKKSGTTQKLCFRLCLRGEYETSQHMTYDPENVETEEEKSRKLQRHSEMISRQFDSKMQMASLLFGGGRCGLF